MATTAVDMPACSRFVTTGSDHIVNLYETDNFQLLAQLKEHTK
jgi:hypothetical protein